MPQAKRGRDRAINRDRARLTPTLDRVIDCGAALLFSSTAPMLTLLTDSANSAGRGAAGGAEGASARAPENCGGERRMYSASAGEDNAASSEAAA